MLKKTAGKTPAAPKAKRTISLTLTVILLVVAAVAIVVGTTFGVATVQGERTARRMSRRRPASAKAFRPCSSSRGIPGTS